MAEEVSRTMNKQAFKRPSSALEDGESVVRSKRGKDSFLKQPDSSLWVCENPACRATQSTVPMFCERCSCCICRQFDSNMDPSLWLKCNPDSDSKGSCGFSCHVECALRHRMVGVYALQFQLDSCYSCAICGKVSSIIGYCKKQLKIAMESNRVDVLCYRIFLSYRLLNGTSKFRELHKLIEDLKAVLEMELGPIDGAAVKMSRAQAGTLHTASRVQALCKLAIKKAEELLSSNSSPVLNPIAEDLVPCSMHLCKSLADGRSDSRKAIQNSSRVIQESCSGARTEKCIEVGDAQSERLTLPDLNEEFEEPDAKTKAAPLINSEGSGGLDVDFESIVRTIRGLELGGHVSKEFRLKFLTWLSLKAKEHERRVVRTFIKTMLDDPSGLAGQLEDTFSPIVFCTRP